MSKQYYNHKRQRKETPRTLDVIVRPAKMSDIDGILKVENAVFLAGDRYSRQVFENDISTSSDSETYARTCFVITTLNYIKNKPTKNLTKQANAKSHVKLLPQKEILGYGEVAIEPAGFALFGNCKPVEAAVGKLDKKVGVLISSGVLPKYQGLGLGSKLLEARLDYLVKKEVRQVFAHAWPNGGFTNLAYKFDFTEVKGWSGRTYADGSKPRLFYKELTAKTA